MTPEKTLKEFKWKDKIVHNYTVGDSKELERELKAELRASAIEWVKWLRGDGDFVSTDVDIKTVEDAQKQATRMIFQQESDIVERWIIHFFNLTEEDLKDAK